MKDAGPSPEFLALQQAVAGRFSLDRELGRGGMGIVFLARDVALERLVAIKLLPLPLAILPDLRERFLREARTAAGLSHPNIVPIHSVEERGDLVFFVMGFVKGETLRQRVLRKGPLSISDASRVVQEVAWALAYAHGNGVVHRDVKPDNILLERASGRAMVTDFGIARVADQDSMTARGELLGTAQYMSPEQASAEPVDARSDLYSLGVTAFFALTGRLPFEAPTVGGLLAMHLTESPPPVASLRDEIPPQLAEAVDKCLAKAPDRRPASGEELAEVVGTARGVAIEASPQIRAFLRETQRLGIELGAYAGGIGTALFWLNDKGPVAAVGLVLFVVWLLHVGQVSKAAMRILSDGTEFSDVRAALLADARAQLDEVQRVTRHWRREQHTWFVPADRTAATVFGTLFLLLGAASFSVGSETFLGYLVSAPLLLVGGLYLGYGLGVRFARRLFERARKPAWRVGLWNRLWAGWPGKWFFKLSALWSYDPEPGWGLGPRPGSADWWKLQKEGRHPVPGLPAGTYQVITEGTATTGARPAPHAVAAEPTEVVLGKAADAVFDDLIAADRERLADVPAVIRRLEEDARALRKRDAELSRVLAEAGAGGDHAHASAPHEDDQHPGIAMRRRRAELIADLETKRRHVRERLSTAIAALENLRLGLLRLQAGVGSVDDLTADLQAAQDIGRQIDAELEAREEVESLLKDR